MKKLIQITYCVLLILTIGSCRDDDKYPIPDITRSSIPVFLQGDADTGFINFLDVESSNLAFDVDRLGTEGVTSIDVWIQYNNSETGETETISYTTVSNFPQAVNLSLDQLIALFAPEVVTKDSLSLGDSFVVGGNLRLADGRYLEGGYSPSVVANHPVYLTYNVACASDLAGVYDFTKISGAGTKTTLLNQTIVQRGQGYYELPDISMEFFDATPIKYRFTDICGNLIPDDESEEFGSQVVVKFNANTKVDPVTGVITFDIEYVGTSCCGLLGQKTVFTATPK